MSDPERVFIMTVSILQVIQRTSTTSALILAAACAALSGCDSPSAAPAAATSQSIEETEPSLPTLGSSAETPTAEEIQRRREIWVSSPSAQTSSRIAASDEPAPR